MHLEAILWAKVEVIYHFLIEDKTVKLFVEFPRRVPQRLNRGTWSQWKFHIKFNRFVSCFLDRAGKSAIMAFELIKYCWCCWCDKSESTCSPMSCLWLPYRIPIKIIYCFQKTFVSVKWQIIWVSFLWIYVPRGAGNFISISNSNKIF